MSGMYLVPKEAARLSWNHRMSGCKEMTALVIMPRGVKSWDQIMCWEQPVSHLSSGR